MSEILLAEESYKIIGICMEVHRVLGMGFREVVYKDALEVEFKKNNIPFVREKRYDIEYKGEILKHGYCADFVIYGKIILEIKAASCIIEEHTSQTINYLKVSGLQLGIVVNFGERSLRYKRVLL